MTGHPATDEVGSAQGVGRRPLPIDVEVVGGPVSRVDQAYAWEELADLWSMSPRAMERGCAHLCTGADDNGVSVAIVDAFLVLDGDLVICGGAVARTMRDAIDHVAARLRRRVVGLRERDMEQALRSRPSAVGVSS